jgi:hypothetical protein
MRDTGNGARDDARAPLTLRRAASTAGRKRPVAQGPALKQSWQAAEGTSADRFAGRRGCRRGRRRGARDMAGRRNPQARDDAGREAR